MPRGWSFRTSTLRLLMVAVLAEILPSLCLWALSPTESVRVWYPTVLSYLGEHFLPWFVIISMILVLSKPFQGRLGPANPDSSRGTSFLLKFREYVLFAGLLLTADVVTSCLVLGANWLRDDSFDTQMWYTQRFLDYLRAREPIFLVVLVIVSIALNRPVRDPQDA